MIANSKDWWEHEFQNNWEIGIDGKEQTRYFMKLLLKYSHMELYGDILDWGCALGQGVDEIKSQYPECNVEGYDFSETAVTKAKKVFNGLNFTCELPSKQYDFVITSNCIEHFSDPNQQLREILKLSKEYAVIMAPYNQIEVNEVHPVTINETTFSNVLDGFNKIRTVLIPNEKPELGGGEQILIVYRKATA